MRLTELAERIGAEVLGPDVEITGAAGVESAGEGQLAFFANPRYRRHLDESRAAAVLVDRSTAEALGERAFTRVVHGNPYAAFAKALAVLHPAERPPAGVDPRAVVEPGAEIDPSATVLPLAYVARGARIGPEVILHPHTYVGEGAEIGAGSVLQAGSVVRERCILGQGVVLQPGVVVGSDGFGYALDTDDAGRPHHRKVPQVGIVRIEDDVEIGAGACVDRATTGETVVGRGARIDNLVQIGHNVEVGPLAVLCGQVGIAGSAKIGTGTVLAGQVGVVGHIRVGDGVTVGAQSGVTGDVADGTVLSGSPGLPHRTWLKAMAALKDLPGLVKRVRALEKRLAERE